MWRSNHELEQRVEDRTANLRENQARFELALEGTNDGIWEWNPVTNEVYYAPRFREMLGVTREEFPDTFEAWRDRLHPDDIQPTMKALKVHLEKREPYQVDYRLKTHAGEYRIFHARGQAVWDEHGSPTRMAGSILDVNDQRNAEEQLADLLGMQRGILDSAELGIIATDPHGVIHTCNRKVEELFGYGVSELIGWESLARLVSHRELVNRAAELEAELGEEIKPGIDVLVARARCDNRLHESEWTMLRQNRETFPALVSVTILRDEVDDPVDGYLFVIHDLTEIKIAEDENQNLIKQLQTANHDLSNFAYVVSHDLKAPLRAIASLAE
ncbi:MAG: PAS domain-containing protein [Limisphaerales bacterium]